MKWMDETQCVSKIAGRNINNLRYADDATLMSESKEELKSLLKKVKEESEKFNIQKTTPGDTSMASVNEVEAVMGGAGARVKR